MSAFESLYGGHDQFTLSTQLIKPLNFILLDSPLMQRNSFFRNLPPLFLTIAVSTRPGIEEKYDEDEESG